MGTDRADFVSELSSAARSHADVGLVRAASLMVRAADALDAPPASAEAVLRGLLAAADYIGPVCRAEVTAAIADTSQRGGA